MRSLTSTSGYALPYERPTFIKKLYPNINFELTDTQEEIIAQSTENMFESLRDAIIMSAIILALGLLLDDTVVVMENIERHYAELGKDIHSAVFGGTKEIMFADLSGTITTMIALAPMLFVGGYPRTVFGPLIATLLLALVASYFISITAVPLLSLFFLSIKNQSGKGI
jgi:multidrug efflux pump subunit AcrB